jgi:imidazoleglycerol phosphate dehydratase HisB
MKRAARIQRKTNETDIAIQLFLDGTGKRTLDTPVGFLTHMLDLFGKQSAMDIAIKARGDTYVDQHHTVEDVGIALGTAFSQALGDKKGINRYGFFILPMDEAIATVAVDFAGRSALTFDCIFTREKVGDLPTELVYDFWDAFAQNAKANVYIKVENGRNDHHKIEAIFKAAGRAIRMACQMDKQMVDQIPSTKGVL